MTDTDRVPTHQLVQIVNSLPVASRFEALNSLAQPF